MPPAPPPSPQAAPAPVFVDDTGRRHRLVRLVGWIVGGLTLAYLALLGISLIGSPGLVPLSLPAIGRVLPDPSAAHIGTATKISRGGHERSPLDAERAADGPAPQATTFGGSPAPAAPRSVAAPVPRRTASPAPTAAPSSPAQVPQGNPSPAGTARASRSPAPHATPTNGHGSPRNVKGTPTPSPT